MKTYFLVTLTTIALLAFVNDRASAQSCAVFGLPTDLPVVGDWNGDGTDSIGIYRNTHWDVDYNGNAVWEGGGIDRSWDFGEAGDKPVVGDWNGDGRDNIGVFRSDGWWHLDYNGNGVWNGCGADRCAQFGFGTDQPVVGDWNGDGRDDIGIFRDWLWDIDLNGSLGWEGPPLDRSTVFGLTGDIGVPGDWNGDGVDEIAVYRPTTWSLDLNGNGLWDGIPPDGAFNFGVAGHLPVVADWDGDGTDEAGMFNGAHWYWDGCFLPPVAADDTATTGADSPVEIDVVANDLDPDLLPLSLATSPNPVVVQPSNGTAVRSSSTRIRYTPNAGFSGTDSFRYRVTASDGETDQADVTVTVTSIPGPDITLVNRRTIPMTSAVTVIVRGRNMANAIIRIPDPEDPNQVAPTVQSITVTPVGSQHRYDIVLDTSDPRTEGPFAIFVENGAGPAGGAIEDVRVVPNRPVVDAYTPAVAVDGASYVLMASGANLLNASVQSSHPNISITELDNSDDSMLTGLLIVESGAPPGNFNLTLGAPGGGTIQLPLELPFEPPSLLGSQSEPTGYDLTSGTKNPGPPIYFQAPTYLTGGLPTPPPPTGKSGFGNTSAKLGGSCIFPDTFYRSRSSSSRFDIKVSPLNLAGMVDPDVLKNMDVGEIRRLGAGGVAVMANVTVLAEVAYCQESERFTFTVCIVANFGAELLGGSGLVESGIQCFPGGGFIQTENTTGTLDSFEISSPRQCTKILPPGPPPPPEGQAAAKIELDQCCAETVTYSAAGVAFQTSPFARSYSELDRPLALATPTCGADQYEVEIRAFIPVDHINIFPFSCQEPFNPRVHALLDVGDDRGFMADPPLSEAGTNGFRLEQKVTVIPNAAGCSATSGCRSNGELFLSRRTKLGRTDVMADNALENSPINQITIADYDSNFQDCYLWDDRATTTPSTDLVVVDRNDSDTVMITMIMGAANPTIPLAPDIDWHMRMRIHDDGTYEISNTHDCYPAYEVYINDQQVWGFMPTFNSFTHVGCCLPGIANVTHFCDGTIGDPPCYLRNGGTCP